MLLYGSNSILLIKMENLLLNINSI